MARSVASPDLVPRDELAEQFVAAISYLRSFARALTRNIDAADDLVQIALAKGWALRHRFQPETNFRAWILAILRKIFLNDVRRNKNSNLPLYGYSSPQTLYDGPIQNSKREIEDVIQAYYRLTSDHREVLMLVGTLNLSYDEAASVLNCPPRTVRSRLLQAREELQRQLQQGRRVSTQRVAFYDI